MNDTYCEKIVKRKTSGGSLVLRFLAVLCTTIVMLFGTLVMGLFGIIGGILLIWLDTIIFRNTDVEYEYIYISGELVIDAIYGKKKRKRCRKLDMRKLEILAPVDSDKVKDCQGSRILKYADYSSGMEDTKKYAFIIQEGEGDIYKFVFEPSEEMINSIKFVAPSKVYVY